MNTCFFYKQLMKLRSKGERHKDMQTPGQPMKCPQTNPTDTRHPCLLKAGHRMGSTQQQEVPEKQCLSPTTGMLIFSLCFTGRATRGWNSLTPKWALEPSSTPPWSLTLDFSSSSKITFLDRGGGWGKMASSGSLGSDFTIPRVDGWWEGCRKGPGPGAGV